MWDAGGSSTSSPPPSTSGQISSRPARPQAVQRRVLAHVFGVDVAPRPQGVAVAEPGLSAALGAPHQEIAAPVARQGIGEVEVGSSSALGRSMKKPSGPIFCNRGASRGMRLSWQDVHLFHANSEKDLTPRR